MSPTTFFSLPVELRLQIAAYTFQEPTHFDRAAVDNRCSVLNWPWNRIAWPWNYRIRGERSYLPTNLLAILLVCRQFRQDFTKLAFESTWFVLGQATRATISRLPKEGLCSLRKVILVRGWGDIVSWGQHPFDDGAIHLSELVVTINNELYDERMVGLLRRLKNVKTLRCVYIPEHPGKNDQVIYWKLVGAILREDHHQRYDALNAPNVEATWWEWHLNTDKTLTLEAQNPKPIMPEQDYMLLIKPKVDEMMAWEERIFPS